MRKLAASFFISLDGVVQGPGPGDDFELAGWTMPYWDDDVAAFVQAGMQAADTLLLGRITYQGFANALPTGAFIHNHIFDDRAYSCWHTIDGQA